MLNYYVDPGAGFVFAQNSSFLWGLILGLLGTFLLFFRLFFRFFRKFLWIGFVTLIILLIGGLIMHKTRERKKIIILGIDGMDPNITERLFNEKRLPNLARLKSAGAYAHLATTIPTETVVAWTSFATGLNPGGHGIFDFIMRSPRDYLLYLSLNGVTVMQGKPAFKIYSKGEAFWRILSRNKIPSFIYFCPNTFPAQPLRGEMLSGMGVPDITGTMGRFTFYTTEKDSGNDKDSRGKINRIALKDNVVDTQIYGPKVYSGDLTREITIPLKIILQPDGKSVSFDFQGRTVYLKEGNWSGWQELSFKVSPLKRIYGIARFYLKSIKPEVQIYLSPINFDPRRSLFPISYPRSLSGKIAREIDLYYTQGMPNDTWALSEGRLDEKAFLELVDEILKENSEILNGQLKRFGGGVFFFYLETLDMVQHMFWRYLDTRHPLHRDDPLYKETIFKYYEKIDRLVGEVLEKAGKDSVVMVLSDHGFSSFRKSVHLNRWLLENGLLFLKPQAKEGRELLEDIDWSKTKAYAIGFGGIYLNKSGREYYGIVQESEAPKIKQIIRDGLMQLKDPESGEAAVKKVYFQEDVFRGPYTQDAPDLFVGFNSGFRASWQTALGGVPGLIMEDNKKKWSGDHLIDSSLVPGVLFVNERTDLKEPALIDIAPTILGLYGISKPQGMEGRVLFKQDTK